MRLKQLYLAMLIGAFCIGTASARDFRSMTKIPVAPKGSLMGDQLPRQQFKPLDRGLIEQHIRKILAHWNQADFDQYLAKGFQDKDKLIYTITQSVPRDARLRLLAVKGLSTLSQRRIAGKGKASQRLQSTVVATVDLQLEFNDPFQGQIRLPHSSQFYLQVTESE